MQSRRRLIIAGVVAFVAGLVVLFPARVAYDWFAPPDLGVSGISGSVWSGAATHVKAGNVYVANLKWRFRPFRLITGKLAYAVSTRLGSDAVEADLAFGFGGGFPSQWRAGHAVRVLHQHATANESSLDRR